MCDASCCVSGSRGGAVSDFVLVSHVASLGQFFDLFYFFFFNDTATTEIYTLSLHDALPIWQYKKWGAAAAINGQYKKRGRCCNEKWAV